MLIYTHNPHSMGGKALALAMGIKRIKHHGGRFTGRRNPTVINWGASELPAWAARCKIINPPNLVNKASNKLEFFKRMQLYAAGLTPPWHSTMDGAKALLAATGDPVVCRTVIMGHSGKGIVIAPEPAQLVPAPLYVQYKKKKDEYRVHVVDGKVIDITRKARRLDVENPNWQVRNHANGFIYVRGECNPAASVLEVALKTMEVVELHFGAVDIIWNDKEQRPYVLEVNTAPGLEGQTVDNYAKALRELG